MSLLHDRFDAGARCAFRERAGDPELRNLLAEKAGIHDPDEIAASLAKSGAPAR